eukprot:g168.t1
MMNRALMDLMEAGAGDSSSSAASSSMPVPSAPSAEEAFAPPSRGRSQSNLTLFTLPDSSTVRLHYESQRDHTRELVLDKSELVYYVIDNSGSMGAHDGKVFEIDAQGVISKRGWGSVTRWEEAASKVRQISRYNIARGMCAYYYLLNPRRDNHWEEGIDYVCVDPASSDAEQKQNGVLFAKLLNSFNIRGSTPLDSITSVLRDRLLSSGSEGRNISIPVCYNIITDGEPNNKRLFEAQLRALASTNGLSIFLTINLCTDNDSVTTYYNSLDRTVGNELNGLEVLDDLEAEQREVWQQNRFFVYSYDLHVCRMAGCNSKVADLMDEEPMCCFHAAKLTKELLRGPAPDSAPDSAGSPGLPASLPVWAHEPDAYLDVIGRANRRVYDWRARSFKPLINTENLRRKFEWYRRQEAWRKQWLEYSDYHTAIHLAVAVLVAAVAYALLVSV